MKANSNIRPSAIEIVGDGSFRINYNITEHEVVSGEDRSKSYNYESVVVFGYPTYESVVSEIVKQKFSYDFREAAIRKGVSNPNDPDYVLFNNFAEQTKLMVKEILK